MREQQYGPVFGRGALWVGAWWAGEAALDPRLVDGEYRMKYPTFTVRHGKVTSAGGRPRVLVHELHGNGSGSGGTGEYATATKSGSSLVLHWWPTVVTFSERGCWRVTEVVGDVRLTFVVGF